MVEYGLGLCLMKELGKKQRVLEGEGGGEIREEERERERETVGGKIVIFYSYVNRLHPCYLYCYLYVLVIDT